MKNLYSFPLGLVLLFVLSSIHNSTAQNLPTALESTKSNIQLDPNVQSVIMSAERATPALITFDMNKDGAYTIDAAKDLVQQHVATTKNQAVDFKIKKRDTFKDEVEVLRFQQYYNDLKVEHGQVTAISRDGKLAAMNSEFYPLEKSINIEPTLTEEAALASAKNIVGANLYAWEAIEKEMNGVNAPRIAKKIFEHYREVIPRGELVLIDDYSTSAIDLAPAYKFNVYAVEPLSRDWIYINAHTGKLMLRNPIIKHATGPTRYSGTQEFPTTLGNHGPLPLGETHALFGTVNTVVGDVDVNTYTLSGLGGLPLNVAAIYAAGMPITNDDEDWSDVATGNPDEVLNDDIALDAHWGAKVVANYWADVHGRHSWGDSGENIDSYVHYGVQYDNAFWNGSAMTYGDGMAFRPLTSMDVCAHEVGHAVCTGTSDLVYEKESGAMNEGFSDIWAACIENYVLQKPENSALATAYRPWGIGEQIDKGNPDFNNIPTDYSALRRMDDPNLQGDPKYYGVDPNWIEPECTPTLTNDYCGVHSNSGVLNHWFYLLTDGGTGHENRPVTGIGFADSERIAYMCEIMLNPNSTFAEAREAAIIAATVLFGPCSNQEIQTTNAWHAINVGETHPGCSANLSFLGSTATVFETSDATDCPKTTAVAAKAYSVSLPAATEITLTTGGTAIQDVDYTLSTMTNSFNGSEVKEFMVNVIDDAEKEGEETIELMFDYEGQTRSYTITIKDDDYEPVLGSDVQVIMDEKFDVEATDWSIDFINAEGTSTWYKGGNGVNEAFVSTNGSTPNYADDVTEVRLVSPPINAGGMKDINVKFDWTAGGEGDLPAPLGTGEQLDFGSWMYSFNGRDFIDFGEQFTGALLGNVTSSASVDLTLGSQFNNKTFFIAFNWYNDPLVSTSYSFSVDNLMITGQPGDIASTTSETRSEKVAANQPAYFYADNTSNLIAKIDKAGADLGCVDAAIVGSGDGNSDFVNSTIRTNKVVEIQSDVTTPYEVTLYYTTAELGTIDPATANIAKVSGTDIDNGTPTVVAAQHTDLGNGYHSFSATFTGFSVFALTNAAESNDALAVEWTNFKVSAQKQTIALDWATASEIDHAGFEVQRRAEKEQNFQTIAQIAAGNVNGQSYQYIDKTIAKNTTYFYRIKAIDIAGQESISAIRSAKVISNTVAMAVYPNPATDAVNVIFDSKESATVQILDVNGRLLQEQSITGNKVLNVSQLATGIYFVRITTAKEQLTQRLLIN